jgi:hypothetical protein
VSEETSRTGLPAGRQREELIGPMAAKPTATGNAPQKSRKKWREKNREKIT